MAAHMPGVTADPGIELADVPLHEFIHCPNNNLETKCLVTYGLESNLTESIPVPGNQGVIATRATVPTLQVLRRGYHCIWCIHRYGFTLRGKFTGRNFLVDTQLSVRMHGVHLSRFNRADGDADYLEFVSAVEDMFIMEEIPANIRRWLDLISRGVRGSEYLIRYYIALMEPRQAVSCLMSSRRIFERLRSRNRRLYYQMISWLPRYKNWNRRSYCVNDLMHRARVHKDRRSRAIAKFRKDIRGVLKLARDGWQHPALRIPEHLYTIIVSDDFPRLFEDVHEAMFRAGLLPELHLEATMG